MIEIKELTMDNFEEIKALFRSVFMAPPWNDDWSDDNQLTNYLLDLMGVRTPLDLGLYENGELVGISLGGIKHWWGGTEYYIEELCIKTELQGRGLGKEFIKGIEKLLPSKGVTQIFLMTERTVPAYSFYKGLGFKELSDHVSFFLDLKKGYGEG